MEIAEIKRGQREGESGNGKGKAEGRGREPDAAVGWDERREREMIRGGLARVI